MDHYQDIKIVPDPEFPISMLMNSLFSKLHRVLVQLQSHQVGISFPRVRDKQKILGDVLRLHGSVQSLQHLQSQNWLKGMADHLELADIIPVPGSTQHCQVRRVQVKSNVERLRRRYRKRHGITEQEAIAMIPESVEKRVNLPFLQLKSRSTGQSFRLFVEHHPPQKQAEAGRFNTYGLSTTATIPWF